MSNEEEILTAFGASRRAGVEPPVVSKTLGPDGRIRRAITVYLSDDPSVLPHDELRIHGENLVLMAATMALVTNTQSSYITPIKPKIREETFTTPSPVVQRYMFT